MKIVRCELLGILGFLAVATENENSPTSSARRSAAPLRRFFDRFGRALHSQHHSMDWTPPDTRFAVTIEEIVEHAVGWICDQEEFDAIFVLQDEVENVMDDLAEAKYEKRGSKELEELEGRLNLLQKDLQTATSVNIALRHELERFKRDGSCALDVVFADKEVDYPRFTKFSAYRWLRLKCNITIKDWAPPGEAHAHSSQPKAANPSGTALGNEKGRKIYKGGTDSYRRIIQGLFFILTKSEIAFKGSAEEIAKMAIARDIHTAVQHHLGEESPTIKAIEEKLLISTAESEDVKEDLHASNQLILDYQSLVRGLVFLVNRSLVGRKYVYEGKVNQSQLAEAIGTAINTRTRWHVPAKRTIERILKDSNVGKIKASESL